MTTRQRGDADPSIRITLHKAGKWVTFDIGLSSKLENYWGIVETGSSPRIQLVRGAAAALAAREQIDRRVRALLEDGWIPV